MGYLKDEIKEAIEEVETPDQADAFIDRYAPEMHNIRSRISDDMSTLDAGERAIKKAALISKRELPIDEKSMVRAGVRFAFKEAREVDLVKMKANYPEQFTVVVDRMIITMPLSELNKFAKDIFANTKEREAFINTVTGTRNSTVSMEYI